MFVIQFDFIVGIVVVDKIVNLMYVFNDLIMENVVYELEFYNIGYYLGMFMNFFVVFQECGFWVLIDVNFMKDYIDGVYDNVEYVEKFMEENEGYVVDI